MDLTQPVLIRIIRKATGDGHSINLIDTSGHVGFSDEVERSLRCSTVAELHPVALDEFYERSTVLAETLAVVLRELTRSGTAVVALCGSA